ncbi:M1 family aminopeptidase [Gramella sp. MAR_2010_147]|uniref:ABC transporter permease/M1 family aminopeptidase n=1 Tax=Gramella sp. MAR_2010_147 TaxID=1250205 RepID=UPI00087D2ED3|nr:M1 family aminopeptidase [Gramella sp. MAR_2010_147]SDR93901.1 Peptidase family M1 [Gramella sp. MAR_2010_147]
MWYEIFKFEINYRLNRWDTYLFFIFLFLFSLFGVEFIFQGIDLGLVKKNSPIVIAKTMGAVTGLSMLFVSMIMGVPVLRDFQYNIASLIYVNPISKKDYFLGRYLGSMVVLLFIFSAVLLGMVLSEFMPWVSANENLAFQFANYLQPFLWIAIPILLFGASLFFVSGALTKKLLVVYTQGIFVFVIFLLTKAVTNDQLQALLDPFSLTTLSLSTEKWTAIQRNTNLIPFTGAILYNKLFWGFLSLAILFYGYWKFKLTTFSSGKRKSEIKKDTIHDSIKKVLIEEWPAVHPNYGIKGQLIQFLQSAWFHARFIFKEISFWAIVFCSLIIIIINSVNLGTTHGVDSFPTTYLIIEELQGMSIYFFALILLFYTGELIWKEKEVKIDLIYGATSVSNFIDLGSKFLGLILIYITLILALIVGGIGFQTFSGYYHYELDLYFNGFFLEILPFLILYTFISFFLHIVTGKKFLGILVTLVFFIINIAIGIFGIEHVLVNFGGNALASYSDMNRYGHFLFPFLIVKAYWFFFGILLFLITVILMERGSETSLSQRLKRFNFRIASKNLITATSVFLILFIATGIFIFYNTNILNQFLTRNEKNDFRAAYETNLRQFEYLPQPKITDAKLKVELYPSERSYNAEGYFILKNKNDKPIQQIHIQNHPDNSLRLSEVKFDRNASLNDHFMEFGYHIFELDKPLLKGDSIKMNFKQTLKPNGFEIGGADFNVLHNGTFFENSMLPTLSYNRDYEIDEDDLRAEYNLPKRMNKANRNHFRELKNARTGSDSDGLTLEMIIGTEGNQTAITSGDLISEWKTDDRNYFHYKTNQPIINFYPIVSANYQTLKAKYQPAGNNKPVDLEIYHHKSHKYNLESMMQGMKKSLDYYSVHFSPYQYNQLRIVEFPRYRQFAQSFPSTIPFSEALGFILDIQEENIDMVFYITAHEVAHQWWGLQLEAANVKGRNMILETLSQYSAMMVLKQTYGEDQVEKFLKNQLDDYLEGKRKFKKEEVPLSLVENEDHIYYAKGAINMYALQKAIGEENVNIALRNFLNDWHTFNNPTKLDRYSTTEDLLEYFRQQTPDSMRYLITDLFEKVTPVDLQN